MAEATGIGWTDATFNPWIGCEKVSPGCAHCYAETLVHGRMGRPGTWGADGTRQVTSDSNWRKPLQWARLAREGKLPDGTPNLDGHRPRVFCASLADVFEERPELEDPRARLFCLIAATPELDWQLLTKRPEFARDWLFDYGWFNYPQPNVWIGVSIENARHTWRADVLREIPAAVRFISAEPLLGSLYPEKCGSVAYPTSAVGGSYVCERERGHRGHHVSRYGAGAEWLGDRIWIGERATTEYAKPLDLTGIDWVIVGGESGPGARPMRLDWAREILEAVDEQKICEERDVALFVKQLGARPVVHRVRVAAEAGTYRADLDAIEIELRDRKGGDWDEWPADLRIREFPATAAVPA